MKSSSRCRRGVLVLWGLLVPVLVTTAAGSPGSETGTVVRPANPEDGGPRNWTVRVGLNLRESPSTAAAIVARFAAGETLDNLRCEEVEGRYWCYVQPLGGGPVGFVAAEFLDPAVAPNGVVMTGPDDSALRAGLGDFDATGKLPCARSAGQPTGSCDFSVARAGGGYATVVVIHPGGHSRNLYFRMGVAIGAGTAEADDPGPFSQHREADLTFIRLGQERYEVPDAVILGG